MPTSSSTAPATDVRRRRLAAVAGVALGLGALAALLAAPAALGARADLVRGRQAALDGRAALAQGDVRSAQRDFERASAAFANGARRLRSPLAQPARLVPVVSRNLRAVRAVATAGGLAAEAATTTTGALLDLPGGPSDLAPRAGRIPVDLVERLAGPLEESRALLERADRALQAAPRRLLVPQVAAGRAELAELLGPARETAEAAAALSRTLPAFLGADGPRRYFFAAQNPAELRGTGGLLGVYAIMEADGGRISFGDFERVGTLPDLPVEAVAAPSPGFAARYDRFGGAGFWHNLNMTPDVPSAASAIVALYEEVTGEPVDGVVLADPSLLAALLDVTGPVEVPPFGAVPAGEVVEIVTNTAYAVLESNEERTAVLGHIAGASLDRFLGGGFDDPAAALEAIAGAAAGGHLFLYATRPDEQAAFEVAGVAGRLVDPAVPAVGVFANNEGGNKLDFFARRTVSLDVELHDDGGARALLTVSLANRAELEGQPDYVTGVTDVLPPGEYRQLLSVYCAPDCELTAFSRDGTPDTTVVEEELGHRVYSTVVQLAPGAAQELAYELELGAGWAARDEVFTVLVQDQPTIEPTELRVAVHPPEDVGRPSVVEHTGPPRVTKVEVAVDRPWRARAWARIRDLLGRPVFRIER